MGSSASCSIALVSNGKSFYWTGETISGNVILTVDRSLKVKCIDMNLIGQLVYTESDSDGYTTVRKNFYVERHSLFIPPTNGISYDAVSRLRYSKILKNKIIVFTKVLICCFW
jgi:hypothetical protein